MEPGTEGGGVGRGGGWEDSSSLHGEKGCILREALGPGPFLEPGFRLARYVELANTACTFEPHESFFSLFSDPRSTRLTRIHLREDLVQDQDLEAIRKQVRPSSSGHWSQPGEAGWESRRAGAGLGASRIPIQCLVPLPLCEPLPSHL